MQTEISCKLTVILKIDKEIFCVFKQIMVTQEFEKLEKIYN